MNLSTRHNYTISTRRLLILAGLAMFLVWFSNDPNRVESIYSSLFYQKWSWVCRKLTGWLPVSIGDLIYAVVGFRLLIHVAGWIKKLFSNWRRLRFWLMGLRQLSYSFLCIFIFFYVVWGLNYSRLPVAAKFGFKNKQATKQELVEINQYFINQCNLNKTMIDTMLLQPFSSDEMLEEAQSAYSNLSIKYEFARYVQASVKPSLFGSVGDYLGITGYYNPFTGEAQVNTGAPPIEQPFIYCHEMAHQIGFAKENEANFVGFLACVHSDDPRFRYAACLELYQYANRQLMIKDSAIAKSMNSFLSPAVKKDLLAIQEHYQAYENAIEPWVSGMYSIFLMGNRQPGGIKTYGEVVSMVVAYKKHKGLP